MARVLYVDGLDAHEKEKNAMVITPNHLNLADAFQKEVFDKVIVLNSKSDLLTGKAFFNLWRALKPRGVCEVVVDQPIAVMQQLDAGEIEANGKLGGFSIVTSSPYDTYISSKGQQTKFSTIKLTMNKE
jgi:hypothetical protein